MPLTGYELFTNLIPAALGVVAARQNQPFPQPISGRGENGQREDHGPHASIAGLTKVFTGGFTEDRNRIKLIDH
jgi:hypothetical protein